MGEMLVFNERKTIAKGLNHSALPDEKKILGYIFYKEYENLSLLKDIKLPMKDNPALFYPGCGADILFPLKYLEIFPKLTKIDFIFNDVEDNLGLIKTILDDIGISFLEKEQSLKFYWNNILVNLQFIIGNVFAMDLPEFDIYFERAFRIMKSYHPKYEIDLFNKLNDQGVLISDSGFENIFKSFNSLKVSPELSTYKEMIIGIKQLR